MDASFSQACAATLRMPLTEVVPETPGDHAAALGFALAWTELGGHAPGGVNGGGAATGGNTGGGITCWAERAFDLQDQGTPHADGLAQFGLALDRLLIVRTRDQADALWASEQMLTVPGATVLCAIAASGGSATKPLHLTATRRLLLAAEKHKTRCVLLRLDLANANQVGSSAARARWRIAAQPSQGVERELGAPAFLAHLDRNRAGPAGLAWSLHWNAATHEFDALDARRPDARVAAGAVDGGVAAAPADRPAAPAWRRIA